MHKFNHHTADVNINYTIKNAETWVDLLEHFVDFLKACGFLINNEDEAIDAFVNATGSDLEQTLT